ncbi:MAG: hypothetical protein KME15_27690 [Drouetiella hepatica Uher 2000/2452]|jgi:metal-dependent HD superfamily phosphatase/phosphodiesterase|uniref:Uncharacterized protein n=1 Tax=Drouetiella hepatica Uher 2000/2452 TaxID=904376 RepID=A0A951QG53_9CYAN|nr:hypothetical protein [Drouetiella hepatica Uher 2000/2452]
MTQANPKIRANLYFDSTNYNKLKELAGNNHGDVTRAINEALALYVETKERELASSRSK